MELFTERLHIRNLRESDLAEFEGVVNEVQKKHFGSSKGFLDWLIGQYAAMDAIHGLLSFGIFERRTGEFLGTVGVGEHDDLHETEIFYHLREAHRGRGYAAEAALAVTKWALERYDLPYVIGTAEVDNLPSRRVLERCGYRLADTRTLLVHVTGERRAFAYYRFDREG